MTRDLLRISEIAELLGITPKTVRHYHKLQLLPEPMRSDGGYRLYSSTDLFRLRRIRRLQSLGLSLQQVKIILNADDPDTVLRPTLEALQKELALQQARIEARQQRIEHYLAEEVSLVEIDQPNTPSPTHELLQQKAHYLPEFDASLSRFDIQVFSQWDDFNFGEAYADAMGITAEYFDANTEQTASLHQIIERMILLQTMSADDPQVESWAKEAKASIQAELLPVDASTLSDIAPPLAEVMKQIFIQSSEQNLMPAQRRFLELLISP
jgi:DNA-binding transcriptional MerR regulator